MKKKLRLLISIIGIILWTALVFWPESRWIHVLRSGNVVARNQIDRIGNPTNSIELAETTSDDAYTLIVGDVVAINRTDQTLYGQVRDGRFFIFNQKISSAIRWESALSEIQALDGSNLNLQDASVWLREQAATANHGLSEAGPAVVGILPLIAVLLSAMFMRRTAVTLLGIIFGSASAFWQFGSLGGGISILFNGVLTVVMVVFLARWIADRPDNSQVIYRRK